MKKAKTKKKEIIKIGYKALYQHHYNTTLTSWSSPSAIEYKYNTWTKRPPKCGPLAIFKSKASAISFVEKHSIYTTRPQDLVFKCKYIPSTDTTLWTHHYKLLESKIPKDTLFANKVKLIK